MFWRSAPWATSALRDATNRAEFLARATVILETPVEVISGLEEAAPDSSGRAGSAGYSRTAVC